MDEFMPSFVYRHTIGVRLFANKSVSVFKSSVCDCIGFAAGNSTTVNEDAFVC